MPWSDQAFAQDQVLYKSIAEDESISSFNSTLDRDARLLGANGLPTVWEYSTCNLQYIKSGKRQQSQGLAADFVVGALLVYLTNH